VLILGATGSIGRQTVEVVRSLARLHREGVSPDDFQIVGLAAGRDGAGLLRAAAELGVRDVSLGDGGALAGAGAHGLNVRLGPDGAERLVREVEADIVVSAIVGFAGLGATLAAVDLGRDVALANKETLVAAGEIVVARAARSGARLLPVDSEHSAVWQCVGESATPPCALGPEVARVTLTASGGPFRDWPRERCYNATPEQALRHPTWSMGAKVTIDCASLTNKALELIEARWLFGLEPSRLGAIIHPQSIVHALVEFADGSIVAQMGSPDMRTPIQHALTWPRRLPGVSLKAGALTNLEFHEPDLDRFPALALASEVMSLGGVSGAVFNGANEAAVGAFLAGRLLFGAIPEVATDAVHALVGSGRQPALTSLEDVRAADRAARERVQSGLERATRPAVTRRVGDTIHQ
jgi:1-deoxy-D-xylulose-5-phosphate reductoisomerase